MRTTRIRAVGLILSNEHGDVLTLRELNPKPQIHKFEGMRSIPLETVQGDEALEHAVRRLVEEELPGLLVTEFVFQGRYWTPCPRPNVWNWVYTAQSNVTDLPAVGDEVEELKWMNPRDVLKLWLRPAVYEMVLDFQHGVRNPSLHRTFRRVAQSEDEHAVLAACDP